MSGRLDPRTFPHCCGGLPEYMSTKGVHDRAGNFPLRFMFGCDHPIISYKKEVRPAISVLVFVDLAPNARL